MERDEAVSHVIDTVSEIQRLSGRSVSGIGPATRPIGGLEGFDSHNGVEAVVMLSAIVGRELPDDAFISTNLKRALTIAEIADNIAGTAEVASRQK